MSILATNRYASSDFDIKETFEAGIVLLGHEVKSVKGGEISLKGSSVVLRGGEAWLISTHIAAYKKAGPLPGYDPSRWRKLLLKKEELKGLYGKLKVGLTVVPLKVYTKGSRIKLEIGLARKKKKYEKKETIKKREIERDMRALLGDVRNR